MSMSHLRTQTMVMLSGAWINPAQCRPLLECFERGKALLPLIEAVHQGLLDMQSVGGGPTRALDAQITALQGASQAADVAFSGLTRGVHMMFTSVVMLV